MQRITILIFALLLASGFQSSAWSDGEKVSIDSIHVEPESIRLTGPDALRGLLVHGRRQDGQSVDLTHRVLYRATEPKCFEVGPTGVVKALTDGSGQVEILFEDHVAALPVHVEKTDVSQRYHFENDVIPIFSKYGCNSSECHGKAEGQNGFKLSVFGFDPKADYDALIHQGRGRRTFLGAADHSLLLAKASGAVPHGGGNRITKDSREYNVLKRWIADGAPFGDTTASRIARIEISPPERIMDTHTSQQLRVVAHYSNGRELDVTSIAKYQSNNDGLATVDAQGVVQIGKVPGQVAVMATYNGAVNTFQALIPRAQKIVDYPAIPEYNFIDRLVHARLKKLNIIPSALADDAEFMRRSYISIIGTLPAAEEVRQFLGDSRPDKRERIVDELLQRPEYVDYWALKWADLLRVNRAALGHKTAYAYYDWIRQSLAENKSHDNFLRDILTFKGSTVHAPQVSFYRVVGGPDELASTMSQVFLGVRIQCAQCHHHPFDRWSQTDYYGMVAYFQQVNRKGTPRGEFMLAEGNPETKHPRSGARIYAHPLGTKMPEKSPTGDWREELAEWMTSPDNQWFARNVTNRLWAHFMGRGLVVPVDDFRATNPPSNPELLDALAERFIEDDYDVKELIRTITASATFQRSSQPNATNEEDEQNYSRALLKRVDAEVLLDAVNQVTGIRDKFLGVPFDYRAIQLWDSEINHYFLKTFGRPTRRTVCECERSFEPTVGQVLHLLNSSEIQNKLSHEAGQIAHFVNTNQRDEDLIELLYLTFLARMPNSEEQQTTLSYFKNTNKGRRAAAEDLGWSLMNSLEFVFNH